MLYFGIIEAFSYFDLEAAMTSTTIFGIFFLQQEETPVEPFEVS